jgi:uncharacterized membrane-anchored protein YjiN (DUF445 family)
MARKGRLGPEPIADAERLRRLRRMKWIAHLLLIGMLALYVITGLFEARYAWLGYVRAFAEAGTVGALADWFAVTALFREPLGLPIPHTAIVKRRKDDIGDTLADFVATHFLTADAMMPRLERLDAAGVAAHWLAQPDNARRLTDDIARVVGRVLKSGDDAALRSLVKDNVRSALAGTTMTPLLGQLLELVVINDPDETVLNGLVHLAREQFEESRLPLRERIGERTPWWLPAFVDTSIYNRIVDEVDTLLADLDGESDAEARQHVRRLLARVVTALKTDEALIARGEALKLRVLEHPTLGRYLSRLVRDIADHLAREARDPESAFRERLNGAVNGLGENLAAEPALQAELNGWMRDTALFVIDRYRVQITTVISDTIRGWDPEQTADLIETRVGRDLQFIRINGTVVGGLAGLTLYSVWHALA